MRGLVVAAALACACSNVDTRQVRIDISNLPAQLSAIDAWITAGKREVARTWEDAATLGQISAGRTQLTIAVSNEPGPLVVRVAARQASCVVAEREVSCDDGCASVDVALESRSCAVPDLGTSCGAVRCDGSRPFCCTSPSGMPYCAVDVSCDGRQ
jgi:hypothetical protein